MLLLASQSCQVAHRVRRPCCGLLRPELALRLLSAQKGFSSKVWYLYKHSYWHFHYFLRRRLSASLRFVVGVQPPISRPSQGTAGTESIQKRARTNKDSSKEATRNSPTNCLLSVCVVDKIYFKVYHPVIRQCSVSPFACEDGPVSICRVIGPGRLRCALFPSHWSSLRRRAGWKPF